MLASGVVWMLDTVEGLLLLACRALALALVLALVVVT
jgi:hypothetical protein